MSEGKVSADDVAEGASTGEGFARLRPVAERPIRRERAARPAVDDEAVPMEPVILPFVLEDGLSRRLQRMTFGEGGMITEPPLIASVDYGRFMSANDLSDENNTRILFLLYFAAMQLFSTDEIADDAIVYNTPAPAEGTRAEIEIVAETTAADIAKVLDILRSTIANAHRWMFELLAAHQMKSLNHKNIKNYFASKNGLVTDNNAVLAYLNWLRPRVSRIVESEDARAYLSNTLWIKYHTSYCTTPGLVMRFIESLPGSLECLYTEDQVQIVARAIAQPWSMEAAAAIDSRLIGYASIFFKTLNVEIGEWYQGNRAESLISPIDVAHLRQVFSRLLTVTKAGTAVSKATTVDELAVALSSTVVVRQHRDPVVAAARESKASKVQKLVNKMNRDERLRFARDRTEAIEFTEADIDPELLDGI